MKTNYVYVTKCINKNMTSRHDDKFLYPSKGVVIAPDWNDAAECGGGIHGFLWGEGNGSLADYSDNSVWLLIKVNPNDGLVVMDNNCKFRRGKVVLVSDYRTVANELLKHLPNDRVYRVIGVTITGGWKSTVTGGDKSTVTGGNRSTVTGGDYSTVTGGDYSTVTGGYRSTVAGGDWSTVADGDYSTVTGGDKSTVAGGDWSTVTGGDYSTVTGGYRSTVAGGDWSTVTGGDYSTVAGGDKSTVTGGYGSTVTGGNRSTVTGGDYSTVTGGDYSTVAGGDKSTVTGGDESILIIAYWNIPSETYKRKVGVVGEKGLKPNVKYKLDDNHEFVEVE